MAVQPQPGFGLPHSAARYDAGCRCLWCVQAYETRVAEKALPVARHGVAGWRKGCRCVVCEFGHGQSQIRVSGKASMKGSGSE